MPNGLVKAVSWIMTWYWISSFSWDGIIWSLVLIESRNDERDTTLPEFRTMRVRACENAEFQFMSCPNALWRPNVWEMWVSRMPSRHFPPFWESGCTQIRYTLYMKIRDNEDELNVNENRSSLPYTLSFRSICDEMGFPCDSCASVRREFSGS